jgi:scyllo-inositol 2-dehydrogenase (NADP+)
VENTPISVGIVGYGYSGAVLHPALLSKVDGLRLTAVATRAAERRRAAEETHRVSTFSSLTEMLDRSNVQVVVVATPHDTHEALVLEALRGGRHVVCEKVMALTTASADRMIATSQECKKLLTVFQNRRWDGDFLTIKEAVDAGMVGRVQFLEIAIHTHKTPRTWRGSVERSGGLLFDWGAHLVDQALLITGGRVRSVSGLSPRLSGAAGADGETFTRCHIELEGGGACSVEVSYASRLSRAHWYVLGDKGTLVKDGMDPQEAAIRAGRADAREDPADRARVRTEVRNLGAELTLDTIPGRWPAFYENLRDALAGRCRLSVDPRESRDVVAVLEAHSHSVRTGRTCPISNPSRTD